MKTNLDFIYILGLAICLASCTKNTDQMDMGKYVTVSLSPSAIGVEEEPMSRASESSDVYGINIYYSSNGSDYSNVYAYGLFDNIEDMTVSLLTGYYYKFVCSMVKNGKSTLYNSSDVFYYPFQNNSQLYTILDNKFVTGGSVYLTGLASGNAHLIGGGAPTETNYETTPGLDRYYGETTNYQPITGGSVDITLKRAVYGVKFIVNGMSDGIGYLSVSCPGVSLRTSKNCETDAVVRSFDNLRTCWSSGQATLPVNISYSMKGLEWVGDDGSLEWNENVVFKRNYLTTVTINVSFPKGKIEFNLEETLLDENEIDLGIGNNGFIDIVVNPS